MKVLFYIDPETDEPHILNHGISEDEATEIVLNPLEDQQGRDKTRIARGKTENGIFIRIVYAKRRLDIVVITGWEMKGKELTAFRRRMK